MNYVVKYLGVFFKFLFKFKKFLPGSVAGVFLIWEFFQDMSSVGLHAALENLSRSVLACELVINQNVNLAIDNSISYGIGAFLEIVTSVFILYTLFLFLIKFFKFVMSKDIAPFGAYLIAAMIIFVVEYYSVRMLGHTGFIPFYHGIFFLVINTAPVFGNIIGAGSSYVNQSLNSSVNSTNSSVLKTSFLWFFSRKRL